MNVASLCHGTRSSVVFQIMILLLGGSGYIGQAFHTELHRRSLEFLSLSRADVDYTRFGDMVAVLKRTKPSFVINSAGYTGKPNVDACELHRADTLMGNVLFPQTIAQACEATGVPWGHVSSGCIYAGAKIVDKGVTRTEADLMKPDVAALVARDPSCVQGFVETDQPNFSFRRPPCSFYSASKALAEEVLAGFEGLFVWRLRIPFDEFDGPRNYLSKIQRYSKVYENINSISHRGEFARACLSLWEKRAPFGVYNMTNPGWTTTRKVVDHARDILGLRRDFEFWADDEEFYRLAAKTPRSNCVLDGTKLLATGVMMRPVEEALEDALRQWKPQSSQTSNL